ncbi:unnamed protein product [Adineta ricciae]|uniref:C-type lectin domain-containing protein n=1 Tax=Adineta ricciae TaxID=249248 RepID=A0A814MBW8_ADIRI|nr:unnamed protein product [Adineta ricciae]CAF1187242.1 unnamed protein product [Adineta ricciae]
MSSLLIQLFLTISYQTVIVMSIYNSVCTTTCNFPGMICAYGRCKCDWRSHLFWTGVRCLPCPNKWALADTACIGYYGVARTRANAQATCESMQASLISLRDHSNLPFIYRETSPKFRRRKRQSDLIDATIGWTSAQAKTPSNPGLYVWADSTVAQFDSTSSWWCKKTTPFLGYQHLFDEPTRRLFGSERETCVLYRRGRTANLIICLDDVLCDQLHPFICERSETTAKKYPGSMLPGSINFLNTLSTSSKRSTFISPLKPGSNNNPNIVIVNHLGALAQPHASKSNNNTKTVIIIVVIVLLLLAAIIGGVFCLITHNRKSRIFTQSNHHRNHGSDPTDIRPSIRSGVSTLSGVSEGTDIHSQRSSTGQHQIDSASEINSSNVSINLLKQQEQKRKAGGFSKQTFDDFPVGSSFIDKVFSRGSIRVMVLYLKLSCPLSCNACLFPVMCIATAMPTTTPMIKHGIAMAITKNARGGRFDLS